MATLNQDLYGLQYSADFSIQGLQEGDIDLSLPPVNMCWKMFRRAPIPWRR